MQAKRWLAASNVPSLRNSPNPTGALSESLRRRPDVSRSASSTRRRAAIASLRSLTCLRKPVISWMSSCLGRCSSRMATSRTALDRHLALPFDRRPRSRNGLVDPVGRDVEVSHGPYGMRPQHAEPDAVAPRGPGTEVIAPQTRSGNVEDHDISLDRARIELDAGNAGELQSQLPGPLVILRQALDMMLQGIDASCGDDPGLPHGAPEALLVAPGLLDELARAGQDRSHWGSQTFAEIQPDGVECRGKAMGRRSAGHNRVQHSRAVHMGHQPCLVRRAADRLDLLDRPADPADDIAGLLYGDRSGAGHVVGWRTDSLAHLVGGKQPSGTHQGTEDCPDHRGRAADLE